MNDDAATRTSPAPIVPVPDGGLHGHDRAGELIAERLLTTVREDLGRADTKAGILLSGTLALPAFLITRHGAPDWHGPADLTLALAVLLWAVAVIALVRALMPRTGTVRDRDGVTFFADLVPPLDHERLYAEIADAARDPARWLLIQAVDASTILSAKYRAIRWGTATLAPAVALALVWAMTAR
ncbi:Pycsar system effector family protein [Streptomyces sp. NPDC088258]|uniref:Pycsar system effector family protein n=1 Tax=Streptomyces sp. NPDC088258 TaxID=3365849 RepID=UPI0038292F50